MTTPSHSVDAQRMDQHYRYQRFVYDVTRRYFLLGRRQLIADLRPDPGESVLELGCGTGWNLVQVARRYPQSEIFGTDISSSMLSTARSSIRRAGLAQRIHLAPADATTFSGVDAFGKSQFDRIFISFALSMIGNWEGVVTRSVQQLAPGGSLHIVDFGPCDRFPAAARRGFFAFLQHYEVTPRRDLLALCQHLAHEYKLELQFEILHRSYVNYAVLTRG
jgi:S-adenosylmethionine-diacylgycerolhomoserine-N-methlytransferase